MHRINTHVLPTTPPPSNARTSGVRADLSHGCVGMNMSLCVQTNVLENVLERALVHDVAYVVAAPMCSVRRRCKGGTINVE